MFSADEHHAGQDPTQGTELCAVVEALYSLEHLLSLTGDPAYGDRLERVAFNALPATFAPDMWSHQYDQQVNQVQCTINPDHMWSTNGPESNIYGLEPNYGCCTANLHQGWPKFVAHLWMRAKDEGIAVMAYAPSTARFEVRGQPVTVTLDNGTTITINAGSSSGSVSVAAPADDVYVDGSTITRQIASATGGNFESLVIHPAPASTTVTDTLNTTTVTLTGSPSVA